jgi:GntR family transcriptional regulator, transcriptional repressor for pyruvate dehydrogenase complex
MHSPVFVGESPSPDPSLRPEVARGRGQGVGKIPASDENAYALPIHLMTVDLSTYSLYHRISVATEDNMQGSTKHMAQLTGQVYTIVVEAIKERIASGDLLIGQRLPSIQQLAREFGVSTGSVREAARVLEVQGIIRIAHGSGIFAIAGTDLRTDPYEHFQRVGTGPILAVFEARRVLEPALAALAAERATETDIRMIRELAVMMEQMAAVGEAFAQPDVQFHRQIALAAQNPILARMMDGINDLLIEGRRLTTRQPESVGRSVRYHMLIADAIADHNPPQARLLMLAHVHDAIDIAISLIEPNARRNMIRDPVSIPVIPRDPEGQEFDTEPIRGQVDQSLTAQGG